MRAEPPGSLLRAVALVLALPLLAGCSTPDPAAHADASLPDDLTFIIAADTHFGADGLFARNRRQIEAMNAMPGTRWPGRIGGVVGRPRGVLVAGDLTDTGAQAEWAAFTEMYGLRGGDGLLSYPVFEGSGNHDRPDGIWAPVLAGVRRRHGALRYSWDWGDLHLACLDLYPDAPGLKWLRRDLTRAGRDRPSVLFFHYAIEGPYSDWWRDDEKDAFREAVRDFNVIAVVHGHYHGSGVYDWRGLRVINVGSPRHRDHSFGVARFRDGRLDVASWNWDRSRWAWWDRGETAER